ncbi:MAG: hypothetical protein M3022_11840, partial [Actinomycetota bacterium]|nr:hypothetical protein [Actinomycetota bacterium]
IEHQLLGAGVDGFDLLVVSALGVFDSSEIEPVLARPAVRKVRTSSPSWVLKIGRAGGCLHGYLPARRGRMPG